MTRHPPSSVRRGMRAYLPAHFDNPFGLAWRLIKTRSPAAFAAMFQAGLGVLALPLDLCLSPFERRRLQRAGPPERPIVIVCGPPRSGTTLVAQSLIRCLPVAYFNNLTAVFPRAPITANRLFGSPFKNDRVQFRSFYGRTTGMWGPNDALHLWDRWLGADRTTPPTESLDGATREAIARFFGAYQAYRRQPIVCKNNNVNTFAGVVADALPAARFLCLHRDPVFLGQSLLLARKLIHGRDDRCYGIDAPDADATDPIDSVARQIRFHLDKQRQYATELGERFQVVDYEDFCRDPAALVERVATGILGEDCDPAELRQQLPPFEPSRQRKLPEDQFRRLEAALEGAREGALG